MFMLEGSAACTKHISITERHNFAVKSDQRRLAISSLSLKLGLEQSRKTLMVPLLPLPEARHQKPLRSESAVAGSTVAFRSVHRLCTIVAAWK